MRCHIKLFALVRSTLASGPHNASHFKIVSLVKFSTTARTELVNKFNITMVAWRNIADILNPPLGGIELGT